MRILLHTVAVFGTSLALGAQIVLPPVFGDHMVIQRDRPVPVWGRAPAHSSVSVALGENRRTTRADADGHWRVELPALPASAVGQSLTVRASEGPPLELRDVVCGDVWLCSGQSNMRWRVEQAAEADELLEHAQLPNLRLLDFEGSLLPDGTRYSLETLRGITPDSYFATSGWSVSSTESARSFSAVALAFGQRLAEELAEVPIGLVHHALGGSPMEAWLPPDVGDPALRAAMDGWLDDPRYAPWCAQRARTNLAAWLENPEGDVPHHPFAPSFLYRAGIGPLRGMGLRGCIWYQGESNAANAAAYGHAAFAALIEGFRDAFDAPKLPFYFVQLPGLNREGWARFREIQAAVAADTARCDMVVILDVGHPTDVHPRRKRPVGHRLARLALADTYGRDLEWSGPRLRAAAPPEGRRMRVRLRDAAGLRTVDGGRVRGFEIAGEDRVYYPAYAAIDGEEVWVESPDVEAPAAVRYAFADDPDANLVNGALLPAAPFRTDDWDDAKTAFQPRTCSFEGIESGEFASLETASGRFDAAPGHAAISARFAHSGRQCLHILGGEEREVRLTPGPTGPLELSFRAERWTRREPFALRIDVRQAGSWREVYRGDDEIRVGAHFLSEVRVSVPEGPLRIRCTSPEGSGVLIDDLRLASPAPMRVRGCSHAPWIAPLLHGHDDGVLTRVEIVTEGSTDPLAVRRVHVRLADEVALDALTSIAVHCGEDPLGPPRATARELTFEGSHPLTEGTNTLWIRASLAPGASLDAMVSAACTRIETEDQTLEPSGHPAAQRVGIALRRAGQDGCHTYRIPGLATTPAGTLIAVYDCRYRGSGDLPGDLDVGMSRSTDGGRSWEPMRIIMDMGRDPDWRFDGIGDPCVLVDRVTGTIWVAATWSHGNRSWNGSGPGLRPEETGQLMLVRSEDDGLTWSQPVNITQQVKDPAWRFVLAAPGNGLTLRDGTLVFPAQYRSADDGPHAGKPFATLIYSADRGQTWQIGTGAKVDTTENQIVELDDGALMINCRDNRGGSRAVYLTRDLGRTWERHPSSRWALPEPVCMASLIRIDRAPDGAVLLFSNPATRAGRRHMTICASTDQGRTWPTAHHLLYDQRPGFGYSCLTRIDRDHVGVLYEGTRELYFLRIPIVDVLR